MRCKHSLGHRVDLPVYRETFWYLFLSSVSLTLCFEGFRCKLRFELKCLTALALRHVPDLPTSLPFCTVCQELFLARTKRLEMKSQKKTTDCILLKFRIQFLTQIYMWIRSSTVTYVHLGAAANAHVYVRELNRCDVRKAEGPSFFHRSCFCAKVL